VPDEALHAFMVHCNQKVGEAYFRTPRNTIKAFLDLLAVLEQNPTADWRGLIGQTDIAPDAPPAGGDIVDEQPRPAVPGPPVVPATAPGAEPAGDGLENFRL